MGHPSAFRALERRTPVRRPASLRVLDWHEVYEPFPADLLRQQASRCMDCGIPFCHQGCPLGNLIPDWNDLVYRDRWREALGRLHATNNFPEFTGRLCPAPCESACVLGINDQPVTIKQVELAIVDHGFERGWITPQPAPARSSARVAIVGSGPAGLAAAQQLARAGHDVVLFERADRLGGLLRYGIPDFKMHRRLLDRRLDQLAAEGVAFRPGVHVGVDLTGEVLLQTFDAVCLTVGAGQPRSLDIPGADLRGVHFAMEYLEQANRRNCGDSICSHTEISAAGKRVVILGGGDTGADCLGTAHRQGARSVRQFEIMERPPERRSDADPWPLWPNIFRVSPAHEEGGEREYAVMTTHLTGSDGVLTELHAQRVATRRDPSGISVEARAGTGFAEGVDLLLLALGFSGPAASPLYGQLGVQLDRAGRVAADPETQATSVPGVFAAGDARRGASLIVWAIAEGRRAAAGIDTYLRARRGRAGTSA